MSEIRLSQGKRIRYAREAAGLDQQQLADLMHVSRSALSAWERDQNRRGVPFNDLEAIARHTGFDVEFFLPKEVTFTASNSHGQHRRWRTHMTKIQVGSHVGGFRHPALV